MGTCLWGGEGGSQPRATHQENCVGEAGWMGSQCLQTGVRAAGVHAPRAAGLATGPACKVHPQAQGNAREGSKAPKHGDVPSAPGGFELAAPGSRVAAAAAPTCQPLPALRAPHAGLPVQSSLRLLSRPGARRA